MRAIARMLRSTAIRVVWNRPLALALGIAAGAVPVGATMAGTYPSKPIQIISPFSAGSAPDALARLVAQRMSERLGQNITVENRPGAGTTIATRAGASAEPDGYILLQVNAALAYGPVLYPNPGYDPLKSFAPVAPLASWSHVLAASANVPAGSLADLIAYAKANPNQLNIGFPLGQPPQVLAELLKAGSGAPLNSVPYRQVSQLMADLLGGRIQLFFGAGSGLVSLIQQGKLKALAYTGVARYPALPQVPTASEAGLPQLALNPSDWTGLLAPVGTPRDVIDTLSASVNVSLGSPDVRAAIARQGGEARIAQPQEFAAFLAAEVKKWPPLVRAAGMKSE
jgi:tripartite-type tricarboxylate transporter receptor subunit TctC